MPRKALRQRRSSGLGAAFRRVPAAWARALGWLALAWTAAILLTAPQWLDMAHQWLTVSAYQHILFIPPIIGWLVWNRREVLGPMVPRAWWPGLPLVMGALAIWLVGSLTSIDIVAQAGAVLVIQTIAFALLGPRVGLVLLFPLGFAAFLVPFGEEIVPPLQMLTAEMTIALTHLSGIPAEIEGVFIDTPAGLFEVAEACAGVQFVVAMVTLGVLAAKLGMRRWPRRIALMALCVVVPILANGVRAWGTIAIAQVIGAERAGGVDHIIYGWVFFALVVALVLALAWRWFDRDPQAEAQSSAIWATHPFADALDRLPALGSTLAPLLVSLILLVGLWGGLARASESAAPVPVAPQIDGWTRVDMPSSPDWQPRATSASEAVQAIYRDGEGHTVDLYLAAYSGEADPTVASEGAVPPDTAWRRLGPTSAPRAMRGDELLAYGVDRRIAWTSYVASGRATSDPLAVRLSGLGDRLRLRAQPRWLVIISATSGPDGNAPESLRLFHESSGGAAALVKSSIPR
ncbi:exosortase A [Alteriqipengyuania sp. 357]